MPSLPDGTTVALQSETADWEYDQNTATVSLQSETGDWEYNDAIPTDLYSMMDAESWEYDHTVPTVSLITDPAESWEFDHVPPGPMEWFTATDDTDGRIIEVDDSITVEGTATLIDGSPLTDLFITLEEPSGSTRRFDPPVASDGTFTHTFNAEEAGTHSYTVTAVGGLALATQEGWES